MTKELYQLSPEERKEYFELAAYESEKSFEVIEKDYWVVWTLERLFSLPDLKDHLTFKGGTSLSKIYGIINRFSEDVDVSLERSFFGFSDEQAPEKMPSKKKQNAVLEDISKACSQYIQGKMLGNLSVTIEEKLGTKEGWQLIVDPEEDQTLLFYYPAISKIESYIRQFVKIEMGARSEHWPVSVHPVQSEMELIATSDLFLKPKIKVSKKSLGERLLSLEKQNQYDHLISGWTAYWNDVFQLENPLHPNHVKVLIATESMFNPKAKAPNPKPIGPARGLLQLTEQTTRQARDLNLREYRDHFIDLEYEDLWEPNKNIAFGVRHLFRKRETAKWVLKSEPTWFEVLMDYKGQLKSKSPHAQTSRKNLINFLKALDMETE